MKKFISLMFFICSIGSIFKPTNVFSDLINTENDMQVSNDFEGSESCQEKFDYYCDAFESLQQGFNCFWHATEENLLLHINLEEELNFDETYYVKEIENGLKCTITFRPQGTLKMISTLDSFEIKKMALMLEVRNTDNPNRLSVAIHLETFSEGFEEGDLISRRTLTREVALLDYPAIDLTYDPLVLTNQQGDAAFVLFVRAPLE